MNPSDILARINEAMDLDTVLDPTSPHSPEWAGRRVVVVIPAEHSARNAITEALECAAPDALGRHDLLCVLTEAEALPRVGPRDPLLDLTLPDLAAFDVPGNHKPNRAARRKEARRGR